MRSVNERIDVAFVYANNSNLRRTHREKLIGPLCCNEKTGTRALFSLSFKSCPTCCSFLSLKDIRIRTEGNSAASSVLLNLIHCEQGGSYLKVGRIRSRLKLKTWVLACVDS